MWRPCVRSLWALERRSYETPIPSLPEFGCWSFCGFSRAPSRLGQAFRYGRAGTAAFRSIFDRAEGPGTGGDHPWIVGELSGFPGPPGSQELQPFAGSAPEMVRFDGAAGTAQPVTIALAA